MGRWLSYQKIGGEPFREEDDLLADCTLEEELALFDHPSFEGQMDIFDEIHAEEVPCGCVIVTVF